MITKVHGIKYQNGKTVEIEDPVVTESVVSLYLNGRHVQNMVATPDALKELGAGFFTAAGLASSITSVKVDGLEIYVEGIEGARVTGAMESAGGFDPGSTIAPVSNAGEITPEQIFEMREALNTGDWGETGGLHSTVLFCKDKQSALFSDIGRHNTVDKCIGYMVLNHLAPQDCSIGCTGRQPRGMVVKAVHAGIPIVVSRAAATSLGVHEAEVNNITLICFTRDRRFTVYAHPERIKGLIPTSKE
ncbi:MAG TPA: formate dehydrogenase accessory sulfurtransferase FdhD [Methanocorpusculum sp.]|nr:formate dehydrogenase accessory sulfurtransferase FdhD [Methanocorpusculum sp.]